MKLSEQGANFIARHEGFVSRAYRDPVGIWTIGTGFTNRSRVFSEYWRKLHGRKMRAGDTITPDQNAVILRKAADDEYGAAVNRHIKPRTQHEYDGATSVCFNCGPGAAKWKWAKLLAAGQVRAASIRLKTTAITARGKRLRGLVRRRREEAALIEHGTYGKHAVPRHRLRAREPNGFDPEIRTYQKKLVSLGLTPGPADGFYGDKTRKAVLAFQNRHADLVNDGILGRATMAQIDHSIEKRQTPKKAMAGTVIVAGAALTAADRIPSDWVFWSVFGTGLLLPIAIGLLIYRHRKDL